MIDPANIRNRLSDYESDGFPDDYVCPGGCCWENAKDMIVSSDAMLGFCGCGQDGDFGYIMSGLTLIEASGKPEPSSIPDWVGWWKIHDAKELDLFGNRISAQFFYKWADREGLSEHGSSVPGWLTDTGKRLLALMREAAALEPEQDEDK